MADVVDFEDEEDGGSDLFDCEYTSIDAVINKVTVFTGAKVQTTENGERILVAYGDGNCRSAFFTDSKRLKDVVLASGRKFPFRAIIKVVGYGTMMGFKFFSPKVEITEEDRKIFEAYKYNKNRGYRR